MSLILDALRRAERERNLGQPPSIQVVTQGGGGPTPPPQRPRWLLPAIAAAAVVLVALLAWWLWPEGAPEAPAAGEAEWSETQADAPQVAVADPVAAAARPGMPGPGRPGALPRKPPPPNDPAAGFEGDIVEDDAALDDAAYDESFDEAYLEDDALADDAALDDAEYLDVEPEDAALAGDDESLDDLMEEEPPARPVPIRPQDASRPSIAASEMHPDALIEERVEGDDAADDVAADDAADPAEAAADAAASPAPAAPPPRPPSQASSAKPLREMPASYRAEFPVFNVDVHVYNDEPAKRFVLINLRKYKQGERLSEGPVLEEIVPDGIVFNFRGSRVLFAVNR